MTELMDKTLVEVLEIVSGYGGIPSSVLELIHSIFELCSDKGQAKQVLWRKWFIQRFLAQNMVYPEVFLVLFLSNLSIVDFLEGAILVRVKDFLYSYFTIISWIGQGTSSIFPKLTCQLQQYIHRSERSNISIL